MIVQRHCSIRFQSKPRSREAHPINWKNHTCVSMETSACRLCHVFVDPAKMLCRRLFNHLNLFLFFLVHQWGKEVLNLFCTSLWRYIYKYMNWIYIDRYSIIAEGLLFIMKSEKLPCFNKKKRTNLSALYICYSSFREDSLLRFSHCDAAVCHQILFINVQRLVSQPFVS